MFGGLFKFIPHGVSGAKSNIMKQVNIIQDSVTAPLRSLTNEVMGGMWKGEGANRFTQEMISEVIPLLVSIVGFNTNFANAITKGMNRTNEAITQATSKTQTLLDTFKIF